MEVPACAVGPLAPAHDWLDRDTGRSCGACGLVWREDKVGRRKARKYPHALRPNGEAYVVKMPATWPPNVVQRLIDRDGDSCTFCGRLFTFDVPPTRDHRIPLSELNRMKREGLEQPDEFDNLQLACRPCNLLRGHMDEDLFRLGIEDGSIPLPWRDWT